MSHEVMIEVLSESPAEIEQPRQESPRPPQTLEELAATRGLLAQYQCAVRKVGTPDFMAAVRSLATRFGASLSDRDDVLQKVTMHVLRYPEAIHMESERFGPLAKAVRQIVIDAHRKETGVGKHPRATYPFPPEAFNDGYGADPDQGSLGHTRLRSLLWDTSDLADGVASRVTLEGALATLPPRRREVMVRTYYEDQTGPEVAEAMGIPPGTVKSDISASLRFLRGLLQDDQD